MRGTMGRAEEVMRDMIDQSPLSDWFSPETMNRYYTDLYQRIDSFDQADIEGMAGKLEECQYEEIGKEFRLINDEGVNVIVNFGEAEALVERLKAIGPSRELSRQLGRFSVSLHTKHFHDFQKSGLIEEIYPGIFFIPLKEQYDIHTGLKTDNEYLEQTFIL